MLQHSTITRACTTAVDVGHRDTVTTVDDRHLTQFPPSPRHGFWIAHGQGLATTASR